MATETLTTQTSQAVTFYELDLLYRAQAAQIFYEAGQKKNLAERKGNSIQWRRFNSISVNTTALSEGVTPAGNSLSITTVSATIAQYGDFVTVSDMLDMLGIDPVIQESIAVFGQQAGESIETVVVNVIKAGTSVIYAGTAATRASLTSSMVLTLTLLRKASRTLDGNNTKRFSGVEQNKMIGQGEYITFIHPNQTYDLTSDDEWKNHQQYQAKEKLYNGEVANVLGHRILQSTLVPTFSSTTTVYGAISCGQNAFGVVDCAGTGKFQTKIKQVGSAGASDPLDQRGTVGWKSQMVSKILNDNFMTRIETGATA